MLRPLLSPRLVPLHLLAAAATTTALLLGLWQLDAWQARRDLEVRDLTTATPVPLAQVMGNDDPYPGDAIGQPVELAGAWVPEATFLVGDRELDGRRGFWVVTPVAVCDDPGSGCLEAPAMLVLRGWSASQDAVPPAPTGPVEVTGTLQPPEGSGTQDSDRTDDVLPGLRIADALQRVDQDLYGAYVVDRAGSPGLETVTPASLPAAETFTAVRNLLYALEWWVFAAFAAFVWWRWVTDEVGRRGAEQAEVPSSA